MIRKETKTVYTFDNWGYESYRKAALAQIDKQLAELINRAEIPDPNSFVHQGLLDNADLFVSLLSKFREIWDTSEDYEPTQQDTLYCDTPEVEYGDQVERGTPVWVRDHPGDDWLGVSFLSWHTQEGWVITEAGNPRPLWMFKNPSHPESE